MLALLLHSPSPIRHAFYETFLHLHFVIAAVCMGFLWIHVDGMVAQNYLVVALVLWVLEASLEDAYREAIKNLH